MGKVSQEMLELLEQHEADYPDDCEPCNHCNCDPHDAAFACPLQIGRCGVPCHGEAP